MNRLLQGDVGAGKTIVALLAAVVAMENGLQVAFMAPTEILAEQHFATISSCCPSRFRVALLTGSTPLRCVGSTREIERSAHLVARTRSCREMSSSPVSLSTSSTAGVLQRATLREKGCTPALVMTAADPARSLTSTRPRLVDPRQAARPTPIKTHVPDGARDTRSSEEVQAGRQAYIIYPLVEESDKPTRKPRPRWRTRCSSGFPSSLGCCTANEGRREDRG
jgi:ATP-dependent DNA helicase RecG